MPMLESNAVISMPSSTDIVIQQDSPTLLEAQNLSLERRGKMLVRNVSFSLVSDTFTVLMGPNGAGKSILLRLLHGLIQPSGGVVLWAGEPMGENARQRQAMVFQKPVLLRRSVAANIEYVLKKQHRPLNSCETLLEMVGLRELSRQPARSLSGGEQQCLALARALATDPDVLLLDEPTASLDPATVQLFEKIVRESQARGIKIIFVTHDVAQARRLADDIVFLHQGCVTEQSLASTFFESPSSDAARAYIDGRILV